MIGVKDQFDRYLKLFNFWYRMCPEIVPTGDEEYWSVCSIMDGSEIQEPIRWSVHGKSYKGSDGSSRTGLGQKEIRMLE